MLKRDVAFEDLEIDFAALEKRKAAEYDKLNRMVRFALSGACRQQEILRYFGESDAAECDHCDNCSRRQGRDRRGRTGANDRRPGVRGARPGLRTEDASAKPTSAGMLATDKPAADEAVEEGLIEAVRMVLSGVARAQSRIACGKNLVAQMLCGSNSAKVKKLRLNQLSTFGLLWQLKQAEVATLIDLLIAIGCLEQEEVDRFRPVLKLTPLGGEVMRGKADLPAGLKLPGELRLKLRRPVAKDAGVQKLPSPAEERGGGEGVQKLPSPSGRGAGGESGLPPRSSTPQESVERSDRPPDVAKYEPPPADDSWIIGDESVPGDSLEATTDCQSAPREAPAGLRPSEQAPAPLNRPSYYWTWRLLSQGFSAEECLAIRGITREALLDHVLQAAEDRLEFRAAWCLSAETIAALEAVIGDNRPKQIRPLLGQLPPGTRYEEVQIYLKCRSI
jgi:ATP-dependent DNA helicase RecQ